MINPKTSRRAMLGLFVCAFALLIASPTFAQKVQEFDADGIHVLLESTNANQIVAVLVGVEGGYGYKEVENKATAPYTAGVITASGSERYPKERYRAELARLVSTIGGNASDYVTRYTLSCVKSKLADSWKIFADLLQHPLYDAQEVARIKQEALSEIAGRKSEPEAYAAFMLDSLWSQGMQTGHILEAEDVNGLTVDQMRDWHNKTMQRARMTITVVGDVSREEITKMIHNDLATLPAGQAEHNTFEHVAGPGTTGVTIDDRVVPTTYIFGRYLSPSRKSLDYYPLLLGSMILDDRLYEEVRTKRNLSYAPHSYAGGSEGRYVAQISVSTTMPDSTMHVINRELQKIRADGVTAKELKDRRAEFVTEFYMSQQSNLGLASRLYNTYRETGDWRQAFTVVDDMKHVTQPQVKDAFEKYMHNILWTAVGEQSKIDVSNFTFH
jgi:predicted Zn-dependent peptidase